MGDFLLTMPWAVVLILLPLVGAIVCFLWPKNVNQLGLVTLAGVFLSVVGLGAWLLENGVYHHAVGGWNAPLGIHLYADGLSLVMLGITALVGLFVSVYATAYFDRVQSEQFWPLWLFLLTALNALFLSADMFNLYVTLELLGLSAVALVALAGGKAALNGAMRYLLASLLGSLLFLFGVALLYHTYGSLDLAILSEQIEASPTVWMALGLISAGLLLKTALFPLHFWLPPAHASAFSPISALLSALVVKASFYLLLRLWLELFWPISGSVAGLLGILGVMAILWGSLQALRQTRVKMLVAYSTVAQIGYLFLAFPLAMEAGVSAWNAVMYLAISHALAKAAMFMAAGNLLRFGGHDRIADLDQLAQRLPLTVAAFALAGVSLIGLPPSGGFIGKWLLLEAALMQGRWDLAVVIVLGGVLAAMYLFKVLGYAFTEASTPSKVTAVPVRMEWAALLLASGAILLGFLAPLILPLLAIGTPFDAFSSAQEVMS